MPNRKLLFFLVPLFLLTLSQVHGADGQGQDLLERIDAYRALRTESVAEVKLQELDLSARSIKKENLYRVYFDSHSNSIVEMLSADERGRRVLMTDDSVWLQIPTANRPIRITPLQRLLGQANYGDVGRMTWHGSYRVASITNADGLSRPAFTGIVQFVGTRFTDLDHLALRHLVLESTSATATYPRIEVWADATTLAPVRADYILTSGKVLKTGWFSAPEETSSGVYTTRAIAFVDEKTPSAVTIMTTLSLERMRLQTSFFTVRGFTQRVSQ